MRRSEGGNGHTSIFTEKEVSIPITYLQTIAFFNAYHLALYSWNLSTLAHIHSPLSKLTLSF